MLIYAEQPGWRVRFISSMMSKQDEKRCATDEELAAVVAQLKAKGYSEQKPNGNGHATLGLSLRQYQNLSMRIAEWNAKFHSLHGEPGSDDYNLAFKVIWGFTFEQWTAEVKAKGGAHDELASTG